MNLGFEKQTVLDASLNNALKHRHPETAIWRLCEGARAPENIRERLLGLYANEHHFVMALTKCLNQIALDDVKSARILLDLGAALRRLEATEWHAAVECPLYRVCMNYGASYRRMVLLFLGYRVPHDMSTCYACSVADMQQCGTAQLYWMLPTIEKVPLLSLLLTNLRDTDAIHDLKRASLWVGPKRAPSLITLYAHATHRKTVECAALDIMRSRMIEICIGLQALDLPALLVAKVLENACRVPGTKFRRAHTWAVAATVKHWHDKHSPG